MFAWRDAFQKSPMTVRHIDTPVVNFTRTPSPIHCNSCEFLPRIEFFKNAIAQYKKGSLIKAFQECLVLQSWACAESLYCSFFSICTAPSTASTIGNQFWRLYPTPLKPVGDLPSASFGARLCLVLQVNYAFSGICQINREQATLNFQNELEDLIYIFSHALSFVTQSAQSRMISLILPVILFLPTAHFP